MSLRPIERFVISSILEIFSEQKALKPTRIHMHARVHEDPDFLGNIMWKLSSFMIFLEMQFYCLSLRFIYLGKFNRHI